MRKYIFIVALVILGFTSLASTAAGFDCKRASTDMEKSICANSSISRLDEDLNDKYRLLRSRISQSQLDSIHHIPTFISQRARACSAYEISCIKAFYRQKIQLLDNGLAETARRGRNLSGSYAGDGTGRCAYQTFSGWFFPMMLCGDKTAEEYVECIDNVQRAGCNFGN